MAETFPVQPEVLRWALQRAEMGEEDVNEAFPRFREWAGGTKSPTLNQLEKFAARTRTPLGYLFLDRPPQESLPIPDYRTVKDQGVSSAGPDLLEMIFIMQRRQAWARDELIGFAAEPLAWVGSVDTQTRAADLAQSMLQRLRLTAGWSLKAQDSNEARLTLIEHAEKLGVMVMVSGTVASNTHRPLDVEEFRGFVLINEYAPLIFINGADALAAQLFTLAHELAHVWLGKEGVVGFDPSPDQQSRDRVERLCNQAAAEFLVPREPFHAMWRTLSDSEDRIAEVARQFKVSRLMVARRALDLKRFNRDAFLAYYQRLRSETTPASKKSGGDFYTTYHRKLGDRFSHLIDRAVRSGRLTHGSAYRLTGLHGRTFTRYMQQYGGADD